MSGRLHTASLLTCTAGLFAGCGDDDERTPAGELVIGLQTNLSLPDDIDSIELDVESAGQSLLSKTFEFDSSPDLFLPAYFGVRAAASASVHITVRASQAGVSRMIRQITTTVPAGRVALLQVPIDWLCYDADDTGDEPYVCSEGDTCIAGECVDANIDSSTLPDYIPADAGGDCFDTVACFSSGMAATVADSCTIDGATNRTSVALVMKPGSRGICGPQHCLIPLDANSAYGWQAEGGEIQLPDAVCDRLESDDDTVAIATTTECDQKTEALPTCGPWSSAGRRATFDAGPPEGVFGAGGSGPVDAGSDSSMSTGGAGGTASMDAGAGGAMGMDAGAGGAMSPDAGPDATDASIPMEASLPDASTDVTTDALLDASSCSPSSTDTTPPTLLSASLIAADEILLTFSENVVVPTPVDATQFRLSFGIATNAEGAYTYYTSIDQVVDGEPYTVRDLQAECTDQIIARLQRPLPLPGICQEIAQRTGTFTVAIGLFLHFRQEAGATVADPSGNALQDIAEAWATSALFSDGAPSGQLPTTLRVSGELPDAPVPIALTCGDGGAPIPGR